MESELETQLSQLENRLIDMQMKNAHLTDENKLLKCKFDKINSENSQQITTLQEKLAEATTQNEQLLRHIRDLEQSNDDLERAKRHLDATLSDFDAKLNEQIERNELLESEIGEKEELQFVIQRLKDEARDLRQELVIQENFKSKKSLKSPQSELPSEKPASPSIKTPSSVMNGAVPKSEPPIATTTTTVTNHTTLQKQATNPIPLLSASSRISALNIVSDLLRKFGALESKLASCRNITGVSSSITKNPTIAKSVTNSPNSSVDNSPIHPAFKDINANV